MMMSSDIVLGDEALRLGLIQRCCDGDALEQAVAFAQQLADTVSPTSLEPDSAASPCQKTRHRVSFLK